MRVPPQRGLQIALLDMWSIPNDAVHIILHTCCSRLHLANARPGSTGGAHQLPGTVQILHVDCRNGAQKLLGVLITIGEAVAYVVSGMYGDVRELGTLPAVLIILQVRFAAVASGNKDTAELRSCCVRATWQVQR